MENYLPVILAQRYKTGSRDSQRTLSIPGEISAPSSSATFRERIRDLELNGICIGSTRRKVNPFGNSLDGSSRRRTPSPASATQSSWQPSDKGSRIPTSSRRCQGSSQGQWRNSSTWPTGTPTKKNTWVKPQNEAKSARLVT